MWGGGWLGREKVAMFPGSLTTIPGPHVSVHYVHAHARATSVGGRRRDGEWGEGVGSRGSDSSRAN